MDLIRDFEFCYNRCQRRRPGSSGSMGSLPVVLSHLSTELGSLSANQAYTMHQPQEGISEARKYLYRLSHLLNYEILQLVMIGD
jgi:hypothetical protein